MQLVWFKHDLRIEDHAPLHKAIDAVATQGPIIPFYLLEPQLWQQPDISFRQYQFLLESLASLQESLINKGSKLFIKVGEALPTFEQLLQDHPITTIWSHQETWNDWTYQRDKAVLRYLRQKRIAWEELPHDGIIRRLRNRDGWGEAWYKKMTEPVLPAPKVIPSPSHLMSDQLPTAEALGLTEDHAYLRQIGGRKMGLQLLKSFLLQRGEGYQKGISSPLTAFQESSRLSPYLAFGSLSMREVFQASQRRAAAIKALPPRERGKWLSGIRAFQSRLRWHCHFIQKLEDEPRLEFKNLHSIYDSLRQEPLDKAKLEAWITGKTGYPFVDACMRALRATGWINFRMRAMLMSFASYHLWLDWGHTAPLLAQLFIDYEPGIHYSQVQMQSGTTGINTLRIYNPIKQSLDQDPEGIFIRQWVPELAEWKAPEIHEPWESPHFDPTVYPPPIVNEESARKNASDQLYGLRKSELFKAEKHAILQKHGSRQGARRFRKSPRKKTTTKKEESSLKKSVPKNTQKASLKTRKNRKTPQQDPGQLSFNFEA